MYALDNAGRGIIAMVPAGGKGRRLAQLTLRRAKPASCHMTEGNNRIHA